MNKQQYSYTVKDLEGNILHKNLTTKKQVAQVMGVSVSLIDSRLERKVILWDTFKDSSNKFNVFRKEI